MEKRFRFAVKSFGDGQSAVLVVKLILHKIDFVTKAFFPKAFFSHRVLQGGVRKTKSKSCCFLFEVTVLTDVSTKSLCSLPLSKTCGASNEFQCKADFIGFRSLGELFSEPFTIFPALFLVFLVSFQGMVVVIGLEVPMTGEASMTEKLQAQLPNFP